MRDLGIAALAAGASAEAVEAQLAAVSGNWEVAVEALQLGGTMLDGTTLDGTMVAHEVRAGPLPGSCRGPRRRSRAWRLAQARRCSAAALPALPGAGACLAGCLFSPLPARWLRAGAGVAEPGAV